MPEQSPPQPEKVLVIGAVAVRVRWLPDTRNSPLQPVAALCPDVMVQLITGRPPAAERTVPGRCPHQ